MTFYLEGEKVILHYTQGAKLASATSAMVLVGFYCAFEISNRWQYLVFLKKFINTNSLREILYLHLEPIRFSERSKRPQGFQNKR